MTREINDDDIDYYYCHKCLHHFKPTELTSVGHSPCCHEDYGVDFSYYHLVKGGE